MTKFQDSLKKLLPEKDTHTPECHYFRRNHSHDCNCGAEDANIAIEDMSSRLSKAEVNVEKLANLIYIHCSITKDVPIERRVEFKYLPEFSKKEYLNQAQVIAEGIEVK